MREAEFLERPLEDGERELLLRRRERLTRQQVPATFPRGYRIRATPLAGLPARTPPELNQVVSAGHHLAERCRVVAKPILNGLHHEYRWAQEAA